MSLQIGVPYLNADPDTESIKVQRKHVAKTAAYTTVEDDEIIGVDTTSAAVTITLGSICAKRGNVIIVKDEGNNAGTNNVTVATEGSETIDGAATNVISANRGKVLVYSDGTNWHIIGT